MKTEVTEIADRIYRLSTFVPQIGPTGFTFNQFLIDADEPLLFHYGHRAMFPLISAAVASVIPLRKLRWTTCSHVEGDESGALNQWLAAAPNATPAHGQVGVNIWLTDMADRAPRALKNDETIDL
ncbi:MAG: MBL fold metallo-hydrolase, partial [Proteobacteria bacterium]|nr:MBL fold metallo-hydrolase [Pseudomonadota bacterium]